MNRSKTHALTLIAGIVLAAAPASAGEKTPLSSLRTMPAARTLPQPDKDYGVTGLTVTENRGGMKPYLDLSAASAQGYCLVEREGSIRLSTSSMAWLDTAMNQEQLQKELWHLVEKDGKAILEQTRVVLADVPKFAWATSKTSVELREVARSNDAVVWAYRDSTGDLVLIARGAYSGREIRLKPEEMGLPFVSSDCAFGAVRLDGGGVKAGAIGQLRGSTPNAKKGKETEKEKRDFVINASIAKLSRDPEPLLAVSVRRVD